MSVRAIRNLELGSARSPRRETVRLLADAMRLSGERRAALQLAAGHRADDSTFDGGLVRPPRPVRPLWGRERESAALLALLTTGSRRVIRISGLGGVGKTHLAEEVAARLLADHRVPALWVPLGEAPDAPGSPLAAWAAGLAAGEESVVAEVCHLVGGRSLLLVLDGDDTRSCEPAVARIVRECPNVMIMITSRCPSEHSPDQDFPLRALACGGDEPDTGDSAVHLLLSRVRCVDPGFVANQDDLAALTEICRRLDGIPRALHAAASWFLLSTPAELALMARDEPLLLTVSPADPEPGDWVQDAVLAAVGSLPADAAVLLRRAAAGPASWTIDELVQEPELGRLRVAGGVRALLVRGLLRADADPGQAPVRFSALNLVRETLTAGRRPSA